MPVYHLTGLSGSGKSTVGHELESRGFKVIDTDHEAGLSAWTEESEWKWNGIKLKEIIEAIGNEAVFFCGGADNEDDFASLFTKKFALVTTDSTLKTRLQAREPERWKTGSPALEKILEWNKNSEKFYSERGAIIIDGSQSPRDSANQILNIINASNQ